MATKSEYFTGVVAFPTPLSSNRECRILTSPDMVSGEAAALYHDLPTGTFSVFTWPKNDTGESIEFDGNYEAPDALRRFVLDRFPFREACIKHFADKFSAEGMLYRGMEINYPLSNVAVTGSHGKSVTGVGGMSVTGKNGTAFTSDNGTAIAGVGGRAAAGVNGAIMIQCANDVTGHSLYAIGYTGIDGIKAGKPYKLDQAGRFEETYR